MPDIVYIPSELHRMPSIRIPPCEYCHDKIPCESCDHDEGESIYMRHSPCETRKEYDHAECEDLPESIRDDTELRLQYRLEIAHEGAIDETEESKY